MIAIALAFVAPGVQSAGLRWKVNFPVKPVIKDGATRFSVRLAPAKGIMVRIRR